MHRIRGAFGPSGSRFVAVTMYMGLVSVVCSVLYLVPGCLPSQDCESDADCSDGDPCTTDTCQGGTCDFEPECKTEADCVDGDPCTQDNCFFNCCSNAPIQCPDGQTCLEGECAKQCESDSDCNDFDACTADTCPDGLCRHATKDCADQDACTTDECDPSTGNCTHTPKECPPAQVCDPSTGNCTPKPCETDEDCDDGLFCNGKETCDALPGLDGDCQPGPDPCPNQECDEGNDACIDENASANPFTLGDYFVSADEPGSCVEMNATVSLLEIDSQLILRGLPGNGDIALELQDSTGSAQDVVAFGIAGHLLSLRINLGDLVLDLEQPDTGASCHSTLVF